MAYKQEAELIREDIDLYTFLGLTVFVAYFVSWGTDFYKDCRKKSKAKKARKYRDRDRRRQVAEEKEIEMIGKGEYKENGMNTVKNPMHQNINISPVGKKKDKKKKYIKNNVMTRDDESLFEIFYLIKIFTIQHTTSSHIFHLVKRYRSQL